MNQNTKAESSSSDAVEKQLLELKKKSFTNWYILIWVVLFIPMFWIIMGLIKDISYFLGVHVAYNGIHRSWKSIPILILLISLFFVLKKRLLNRIK
jgi:hypothetical protein